MKRYYYAGGEKRALDPVSSRVAVDSRGAKAAGLTGKLNEIPVEARLPSGMAIVARDAIPPALYLLLDHAGAVQPVYRVGPALVVLMPEVRVELDADQHTAALKALKASRVAADITDDTPERLSLRPQSGSAEDALDLANFIFERARPAAVTVRMLQVIPRPDPKP